MNFVELFAGIGGFSLGFERAGMNCVGHVEIDPYAQKVLKKHWPDVPLMEDVRNVKGDEFGKIDLLCGGFPCQDLSIAGKQKGITGSRSGLYDEIIRIAGICRPKYIVLENVANLLSRADWFGYVLGRIAKIGYDAEWEIIQASDVGAPHKRARVWIVAYPRCKHGEKGDAKKLETDTPERSHSELHIKSSSERQPKKMANSNEKRLQRGTIVEETHGSGKNIEKQSAGCGKLRKWENWATEPKLGRVADGIPDRSHRLKCLGNALVPQIAELIGEMIMNREKKRGCFES